MAQQISPIHALLVRLLAGWTPQADEIDASVPQVDALNWQWSDGGRRIGYQTTDRQPHVSDEVVYVDQNMTYALTVDALLWLYDAEESEKVRYLGG